MNFNKILVLGSTGFVGRNFIKSLDNKQKKSFLFPKREELDLFNIESIKRYLNINYFLIIVV